MKYLKQYEDIDNEPKIGDYVICYELGDVHFSSQSNSIKNDINSFISVNIGQIREYDNRKWYEIEYENIPKEVDQWFHASVRNCRSMLRKEIIHFAETKEELEPYISANKYNL